MCATCSMTTPAVITVSYRMAGSVALLAIPHVHGPYDYCDVPDSGPAPKRMQPTATLPAVGTAVERTDGIGCAASDEDFPTMTALHLRSGRLLLLQEIEARFPGMKSGVAPARF